MGNKPSAESGDELSPDEMQRKVNPNTSQSSFDEIENRQGDISLSKDCIDFGLGDRSAALDTEQRDQISLRNHSQKKLKWRFDAPPNKELVVTFKPSAGTLDKGKSVVVKVTAVLVEQASLNTRANLRVGKETVFVGVRIHADQGVFGVDPTLLDQMEDHGFMIPKVLAQMRTFLAEHNAWTQEGVFRLAGDASDIKQQKADINRSKEYVVSDDVDVNATANLLKIWFRDLPTPILNVLDPQTIFKASNEMESSVSAFERLQEPQKTLLGWLLDMLAEVSKLRDVNKMSSQNLAIVVAPNLYEPPGSDPMEGLVMSQKAVQLLHNLLLHHVQQKG